MTITPDLRDRLVGTDDEPGMLDEYKISVVQAQDGGKPLIVWTCPRQHGSSTGHLGVIARNLDGDQSGLTLGELVAAALDHEDEGHGLGCDAALLPLGTAPIKPCVKSSGHAGLHLTESGKLWADMLDEDAETP